MVRRVVTMAVVALSFVLSWSSAEAQTLPSGFQASLVASVSMPTALAFTPDGRLLITTQRGQLRIYQQDTLLATPALDLGSTLCTNSERGLLGVAVDPAFATNRYIYLYFTFNKFNSCPSNTASSPVNRVSRFTLQDNNTISRSTELVLIDNIPSPNGNHNGGDLHIGRDGFLYVSVGDGGCDYLGDSGCAGANNAARDQHVLLGKILRITTTGGIPASNPYQGTDSARCNTTGRAQPGQKCRETFAWGLRNPFRLAFDPNAAGTRFFINDVGQNAWEEIDEGRSGADYGWSTREGHCANGSTSNCGSPPAGMTNPIFDYAHANGCASITGGAFVPSGIWSSAFEGAYLYSDYVCGVIFRLTRTTSGTYTSSTFASGLGNSSAVAMIFGPFEGTQALYYTTYAGGGQVRRIAQTSNRAPNAVGTATPTSGAAPLTVRFDASASTDPDGDPLTFEWSFGDGTGPVNGALATHTYATAGSFMANVTVRDGRGGSAAETFDIDAGNRAPTPVITAPTSANRFTVGQTITLTGTASDPDEGTLPSTSLVWTVLLHHNTHTHPYFGPARGNNVTFTAPAPEDLAATGTSYLEIQLTATDAQGATSTTTFDFQPRLVNVTFESSPSRLYLGVNGTMIRTPAVVLSWAGYELNVGTAAQRDSAGQAWVLASWSDGGSTSHTIVTPAAATTYRATFARATPVTPAADAYVRGGSYATRNFGSDAQLHIRESSTADSRRRSFLRFTVPSGQVGQAILRLRGAISATGNVAVGVFPVTSSTWPEGSVNWNTQPAYGATAIATAQIDSTTTRWYDVDVSAYVRAEVAAGRTTISLALASSVATTPYAYFSSRNGSSANRPELLVSATAGPVTVQEPPPAATESDVVLYGTDAQLAGNWQLVADPTAAGSARAANPDTGAPKLTAPRTAPAHYVEFTFTAEADRPYRLWIRGKADRNMYANDSAFVQFSGSVNAAGTALYRIGTTSAVTYILEDCSACGVTGWGWQDNGYEAGVLGPPIYFAASGPQTLRIQAREDGLSIDQVVLSPSTYLTTPPGTTKNDATILPKP